jgi:hypothetical protein
MWKLAMHHSQIEGILTTFLNSPLNIMEIRITIDFGKFQLKINIPDQTRSFCLSPLRQQNDPPVFT